MMYDYKLKGNKLLLRMYEGKLSTILREIEAKENIQTGKVIKFKNLGLLKVFLIECF